MKLVIAPVVSAVGAGAAFDISAFVEGNIRTLVSAKHHMSGTTTTDSVSTALTVVTTTPGAGQIQLSDKKEVTCGDALATTDILALMVEYELENLRL